jgi:hypothetical protein
MAIETLFKQASSLANRRPIGALLPEWVREMITPEAG